MLPGTSSLLGRQQPKCQLPNGKSYAHPLANVRIGRVMPSSDECALSMLTAEGQAAPFCWQSRLSFKSNYCRSCVRYYELLTGLRGQLLPWGQLAYGALGIQALDRH